MHCTHEEKYYLVSCEFCRNFFRKTKHLKKHMKIYHSENKPKTIIEHNLYSGATVAQTAGFFPLCVFPSLLSCTVLCTFPFLLSYLLIKIHEFCLRDLISNLLMIYLGGGVLGGGGVIHSFLNF